MSAAALQQHPRPAPRGHGTTRRASSALERSSSPFDGDSGGAFKQALRQQEHRRGARGHCPRRSDVPSPSISDLESPSLRPRCPAFASVFLRTSKNAEPRGRSRRLSQVMSLSFAFCRVLVVVLALTKRSFDFRSAAGFLRRCDLRRTSASWRRGRRSGTCARPSSRCFGRRRRLCRLSKCGPAPSSTLNGERSAFLRRLLFYSGVD